MIISMVMIMIIMIIVIMIMTMTLMTIITITLSGGSTFCEVEASALAEISEKKKLGSISII
jgi:hypothetical protein